MAGSVVAPASAQDEPPVAERMPLAARSLLLDITQTPEGRFVAVGERGHIVLSGDGSEWDQAELVPSRSTLTAVTSAGNLLWAGGHDTTIVFSEDGGRNWTLQYFDPERQQPILDIHFVDEQTGFAIGAYGLMLRTDDGGLNWEDFEVSEESWHLNGLVDMGGGQLFIAGEAGLGYLSEDGGETWGIVEMPYPGSMFGAITAGPCVVAFGLRGNVQEFCDDEMFSEALVSEEVIAEEQVSEELFEDEMIPVEMAWEALDTPVNYSLAGAAYHDGVTLLAGNSGQILIRREDGEFEAALHPSGVDFAAVVALGNGDWLLVGGEGSHLFTDTGGE